MSIAATHPAIYAIATMDTKGEEIGFVAERIRAAGAPVTVVDVSTQIGYSSSADITAEQVAMLGPQGQGAAFRHRDRGQAIAAMSEALTRLVEQEHRTGRLAGVIGIGGGGGTSLITRAMRALPIGVPKLMVSTLASGDVAPYVDCSDIIMMPAVVDLAGINRISSVVLAHAAHAMAGMVQRRQASPTRAVGNTKKRRTVALTMFGVTTPCVTAVQAALEAEGEECLVFHATGTGGRTMEKLVESGFVDAVLDLTTTEVCDEIVGGVFSGGPERFDRIIARGIPYVMSLGALDMVNFGSLNSVPERFRHRTLHAHNAEVTLMRTTAAECRHIGRWIGEKVNRARAPLIILIPEGGLSALDAPGQPFFDPAADAALFEALDQAVHQDALRQLRRVKSHINDPAFAHAVIEAYRAISAGRH